MPFLGSNSLTKLLKGAPKDAPIISSFNEGNIKNGAYELSLGAQVFQTGTKERLVKNLNSGQEIYIEPGQFALLLTEETIKMPKDKIAFISIKAGIKFKGLVNVSGFHVDPDFEGKLLFSVYNAGPSTILLRQGTRYFPMWFATLSEDQTYSGKREKQTSIPTDPVEALSQGELASPNALSKRIDEIRSEYDKKFAVIEKEATAKDYLIKTALGLGVIILVKFILDWVSYNNGFSSAIELKEKTVKLDSSINARLNEEKTIRIRIDSLNNEANEANEVLQRKLDSVQKFKSKDQKNGSN